MNKIFSMNKKLIERVLLIIFLGASFAISSVSYAAPKFASLYQQGGIGRCITEARRSAIYLANNGPIDWRSNTAWKLAGLIFATGRIGPQPNQFTEQEFVELLDATPLANIEPLPVDGNSNNSFGASSSSAGQELPIFTMNVLKELANKQLDANKKIVIHGGGLVSISNFLLTNRGYAISSGDSSQTGNGIWVTPVKSSMPSASIYRNTLKYACINTPMFFDQPVVMVATIDGQYLRGASDYAKVINETDAGKLQDVKIYRIAAGELTYDRWPAGSMSFDSDSDLPLFNYIGFISGQISASLRKKLSRFICNEKLMAQVEYYFATGEVLPTLVNAIGGAPVNIDTAATNLNPNITDNAEDRANTAAALSWLQGQGWQPSGSSF